MTAIACWISFSIRDTFLVKLSNPRRNFCCCFAANAEPVLLVGGGMPGGLDCDRVPMAGGASLIAAVATCDLVRARVVVSLAVVDRCMFPTRRFLLCSRLVALAILLIVGC
jgi:hypothetical protein